MSGGGSEGDGGDDVKVAGRGAEGGGGGRSEGCGGGRGLGTHWKPLNTFEKLEIPNQWQPGQVGTMAEE